MCVCGAGIISAGISPPLTNGLGTLLLNGNNRPSVLARARAGTISLCLLHKVCSVERYKLNVNDLFQSVQQIDYFVGSV